MGAWWKVYLILSGCVVVSGLCMFLHEVFGIKLLHVELGFVALALIAFTINAILDIRLRKAQKLLDSEESGTL